MKESSSVEQHIKTMKELADRLAAINAPISEEDQIVTLLGTFLSSYSTLVTVLEARDAITLGGHYLESKQRRAENLTRRRYVSAVEKLVISAEIVQEISRCPSPSTKPGLQLLSLRDLTLILSVIQMREHLEHLLSQVILRDGLFTLDRQAI